MAGKMTILVGTIGQAIMRSRDAGGSWHRVGVEDGMHSDAIVRTLVSDPRHPEVVYAGTDMGLYRSEDGGGRWRLLDTPLRGYCVWSLAVDGADPDVIFAGTGTPTPCALFRSTDGGRTWRQLPVEIAKECMNVGVPRATGIAIDPLDRRNVWLGLEVDGTRRSRDGGDTWVAVNGGIPNPDVHSVAVIPGPPKTVFVLVNNEIYTSTNDGITWEPVRVREVFPWGYPRSIAVHPEQSNVVYVTVGDTTPGRTGAVMRSQDAGRTWESLPLPVQPNSAVWVVSVQRHDPTVMFAASRYGYLYRSDDCGESWRKLWREFSEISSVVWVPD